MIFVCVTGRSIVNQLEFLIKDVTSLMQTTNVDSLPSKDESSGREMEEQTTTIDEVFNFSLSLFF